MSYQDKVVFCILLFAALFLFFILGLDIGNGGDKEFKCYYTVPGTHYRYAVMANVSGSNDIVVFRTNDLRELSAYISAVDMCGFKQVEGPKA